MNNFLKTPASRSNVFGRTSRNCQFPSEVQVLTFIVEKVDIGLAAFI